MKTCLDNRERTNRRSEPFSSLVIDRDEIDAFDEEKRIHRQVPLFSEAFLLRYRSAIVALVYMILTVALTYPLVFHLNDHLIGRGTADVWLFPWNNFIFKERILSGKDPYFTDRIFHPIGSSLLLHTNTEVNSVIGLILSPFLSELGQMNVGLLLSGFLSALGTYLLTLRLTGSFAGALFAGIAFAFCPFRITRYFGHINFALTQTLPFALWAFLRMAETKKFRYAFLTGLFFALTYYSNQYYMMFLIISFVFMTAYGLCRIPSWRTPQFFKNLCMSGFVAGILLSQVAWHFVQDKRDKVIAQHSDGGGLAAKGSADLGDYFIAGPMAGNAAKIYGTKYAGPHYKVTTGFITLALAIGGLAFAIRQRNQPSILVGLLGILFLLITLGPFVDIGNYRLPLPYAVLMKIPYMNHVRLPYRAAPMVALSFAVMAGFGISILIRFRKRWRNGIVAFLFCALLFELSQVPLKLSKFDVPEVYYRIQTMADGTMLTLPFDNNVANAAHQMKYQIVHQKDLLNGRIARATPVRSQEAYLRRIPIARSFESVTRTRGRKEILQNVDHDRKAAPAFRQFFNVRYLAIHDRYAASPDVQQYVSAVFPDAHLLYEKRDVRVYELPAIPAPEEIKPDHKSLQFYLFSGWRPRPRKFAVCVESVGKLLLPDIAANQTLTIEMRIRSRNPAMKDGKALIKLKEKILTEVPLKEKFERVKLSIRGQEILNGRRLLKIELVDSAGRLLEFNDNLSAKLELDLIRLRKIVDSVN